MCMNNFLKVAFNSTAAGIEPITSNHKSNALTIMPLSHWSTHVDYLYLYIFLRGRGLGRCQLTTYYTLHGDCNSGPMRYPKTGKVIKI